MVPIARRYLLFDRPRLAIAVGGVTFAVLLIVLILALYQGIYDRAGRLADAAPAALWVSQAGTSDPFHGASILPPDALEDVTNVPGVATTQPLLARTLLVGSSPNTGTSAFVMSIPEGPLQAQTSDAFGIGSPPEPGSIVLSETVAKDIGASSGDTVFLGTAPLRVERTSSLVDAAFSGVVAVSERDASAIFGHPDSYSYILVGLADGQVLEDAAAEIESRVDGTNVFTREEFADSTRQEIEEGFLPIVAVLVVVAFIVGLALIALTIYTMTIERVRDYAVLKAVGASSGQLFSVVLRQSLLIALVGYLAGSLVALLAGNVIATEIPEFATLYRWQDLSAVFVAALVMSVLAAVVPIQRISRVEPAIVFRA
ncbi:MAG: FtsX-like permease family protein [Chloroflexi bacterium]|nr:FtsX-like permease family protein [Chloroflexota bacterium]